MQVSIRNRRSDSALITRCIYTDIMTICDIHNRYSTCINVTSIRGEYSRTGSFGILDRKRLLHKYVYENKSRRKGEKASGKHRCRAAWSFLTKTGRTHRSLSCWNRANEAATRFLATHTGDYLRESALRTVTHPPSSHDRRPRNESKRTSRQRRGCLRDARCGVRATIYDFFSTLS